MACDGDGWMDRRKYWQSDERTKRLEELGCPSLQTALFSWHVVVIGINYSHYKQHRRVRFHLQLTTRWFLATAYTPNRPNLLVPWHLWLRIFTVNNSYDARIVTWPVCVRARKIVNDVDDGERVRTGRKMLFTSRPNSFSLVASSTWLDIYWWKSLQRGGGSHKSRAIGSLR